MCETRANGVAVARARKKGLCLEGIKAKLIREVTPRRKRERFYKARWFWAVFFVRQTHRIEILWMDG